MSSTPKKKYYDVEEEEAVIEFINAETREERSRIYNDKLKKPIDKMIVSIIRRYKLYRYNYSFRELHHDTLSHLLSKFEKFDPSANKKSYSYFGTICRNYLLNEIKKDKKNRDRNVSYEDISSSMEDSPEMSYEIEENDIDFSEFISKLILELEEEMDNFKLKATEKKTYENEIIVGDALVNILSDWEILFNEQIDNNKFNKELILMYLRNITGFETKEIRKYMKKYKTVYYGFKLDYIEEK